MGPGAPGNARIVHIGALATGRCSRYHRAREYTRDPCRRRQQALRQEDRRPRSRSRGPRRHDLRPDRPQWGRQVDLHPNDPRHHRPGLGYGRGLRLHRHRGHAVSRGIPARRARALREDDGGRPPRLLWRAQGRPPEGSARQARPPAPRRSRVGRARGGQGRDALQRDGSESPIPGDDSPRAGLARAGRAVQRAGSAQRRPVQAHGARTTAGRRDDPLLDPPDRGRRTPLRTRVHDRGRFEGARRPRQRGESGRRPQRDRDRVRRQRVVPVDARGRARGRPRSVRRGAPRRTAPILSHCSRRP